MIVELLFTTSLITIFIFAFLGCRSVLNREGSLGDAEPLTPEMITKPEKSDGISKYLEVPLESDSYSEGDEPSTGTDDWEESETEEEISSETEDWKRASFVPPLRGSNESQDESEEDTPSPPTPTPPVFYRDETPPPPAPFYKDDAPPHWLRPPIPTPPPKKSIYQFALGEDSSNSRSETDRDEFDILRSSTELKRLRQQTASKVSALFIDSGDNHSREDHRGAKIDWNRRFQQYLEMPEHTEEERLLKNNYISSLYKDFIHVAVTFGKIIISEVFLDPKARTINPISDIGGQAGGAKYIYHGILYKFASDWMGIYGGDEFAMKAGGHEMKALMRYYAIEGISVPLMALIDYRGFRLVAESILPIDQSTIVYGSCDTGETVHADKKELNSRMKRAAKQMNLAGHFAGIKEKKFLWGPCDIEGHLGHDDRFYVLDCARVFPPTADKGVKKSFLYRLFRPEFLQMYSFPLSSDAFSSFGGRSDDKDSDNETQHNPAVKAATEWLYENRIPRVAAYLDRIYKNQNLYQRLTEIVHREGVNMRYLGRISRWSKQPAVKEVLMTEMVARVLKNRLRELIRRTMQEQRKLEEDVYNEVTINFFNFILGQPAQAATEFWTQTKYELRQRFALALRKIECDDPGFDLRNHIKIARLFVRLQHITGVKFTSESQRELQQNPDHFRVVISDLKKIDVRVKPMNVVSVAEANSLAIQSIRAQDRKVADRLFGLAMWRFEDAIRSTPDNRDILNNYADVLCKVAGSTSGASHRFYEKAFENYHLSRNAHSILKLARLLQTPLDSTDSRWSEQDRFLGLTETCYRAVTADEVKNEVTKHEAYKGWGDLLVRKARSYQDDKSYAEAGLQYRLACKTKPSGLFAEVASYAGDFDDLNLAIFMENCLRNGVNKFDVGSLHKRSLLTPQPLLAMLSKMSLTKLDLSRTSGLVNEVVPSITANHPLLQVLNLDHTDLTDRTLELLHASNVLSTLDLSKSQVTDSGIQTIAKKYPNLKKLRLRKLPISSAAISTFSACHGLKLIDLSKTPVQGLDPLGLPALTQLFLRSTSVSDQALKAVLPRLPTLETLDLANTETLTPLICTDIGRWCTNLQSLNLHGFSLESSVLVPLSKLTTLLVLDLGHDSKENLTFADHTNTAPFKLLAKALPNLQELNLQFCATITDHDISDIADHCTLLTNVNLNNTKITDTSLLWLAKGCRGLQVLSLRNTHIGDAGLKHISGRLSLLEELDLADCARISDQGIQHLGKQARLRKLDISGLKRINDPAVCYLVRHARGIKHLRLSNCGLLTDATVGAIANELHLLKSLDISKCLLISTIDECERGCPGLTELNLEHCSNISEHSLQRIVNLPLLRTLKVQGCRKLNDGVLFQICHAAPSLVRLTLGLNKISEYGLNTLRTSRPEIRLDSAQAALTNSGELAKPRAIVQAATGAPSLINKALMADIKLNKANPLPLISASPLEGNIYIWHANLIGPEGTPYAGGIFHIELNFPENYPVSPPSATILSSLPHPHVQQNRICLNLLSDYSNFFGDDGGQRSGWSSAYNVQTILIQLQAFLMELDDEENGSIQRYLSQIPAAIRSSETFVCGRCPHRPGAPDPPLPELPEPETLRTTAEISAADYNALKGIENLLIFFSVSAGNKTESELIRESLACYHSRASFKDDILGIGINVTRMGNKLTSIESPLDFLSYSSFFQDSVREGVVPGETFTDWLPLYINEDHAKRANAKDLYRKSFSLIHCGRDDKFKPFMALEILTVLMNNMIVNVMNGKIHASEKCLEGYCYFHRLLLMFVKLEPSLQKEIDQKLENFVRNPQARHKSSTENLGLLIPFLCVATKLTWSTLRDAYVEESLHRNILWVGKRFEDFTKLDPKFDHLRPAWWFEGAIVSLKHLLFHVYFLEHIGRPKDLTLDEIALNYDNLYGQPDSVMKEQWQVAVKEIQRIESWREYFLRIGVEPPTPEQLARHLRDAVIASETKGYHGRRASTPIKKDQLCWEFSTKGRCPREPNCRFIHEPTRQLERRRSSGREERREREERRSGPEERRSEERQRNLVDERSWTRDNSGLRRSQNENLRRSQEVDSKPLNPKAKPFVLPKPAPIPTTNPWLSKGSQESKESEERSTSQTSSPSRSPSPSHRFASTSRSTSPSPSPLKRNSEGV